VKRKAQIPFRLLSGRKRANRARMGEWECEYKIHRYLLNYLMLEQFATSLRCCPHAAGKSRRIVDMTILFFGFFSVSSRFAAWRDH